MLLRLPPFSLPLLVALVGSIGIGSTFAKPNVVVIISDDGGYADWGFMDDYLQTLNPGQAASPVPTPHLDTLRERGVLFTNGYTASTCSPSRAAIVTGSYQQRIGYEYNINNLTEADAIDGLSPDTVTIFDRMKAEGYTTGVIGKWHIGARANDLGLGNRPENQGVDEFFGIWKGSRSYTIGSETDTALLRRTITNPFSDTVLETTAPWNTTLNYVTSAFAEGAMQFIDDHYDDPDPFFLYVAFTAPHGPIGPSPDYNDPRISGITDTKRREYASMVLTMDKEIGNILAKLDDPAGDGSVSLTDDTLVIFINDNGGASGNGTVNTPLNDWKGSTYEGGNRVPILMAGPGIPGNPATPVSYHKPVHSMDILPTCISVAGGAALPEIDGVNLIPYLDGTATGNPHDLITIRNSQKVAVRKDDWKLTKSPNNVAYALFNLASDPGELSDVSASNEDKVEELQRDFTAFEAGSDKPRFVGLKDPADSINYNDHFRLTPKSSGTPVFTGDGTFLISGAVNNGNFNAGGGSGGQDYDETPAWVNLGTSGSTATATNTSKSFDGSRNLIVAESNSREAAVDTGHDLSAGEAFEVSYQWLDANSSWDDGASRIRIRLFVTDDNTISGTETTVQSMDSGLSQTSDAYQPESHVFDEVPAGLAGKRLFLSINAAQSGSGFARVDDLILERGSISSVGGGADQLDWSEGNAWTDVDTGVLDTMLEFDAFPGAILEFPTSDDFAYTATNDMTRISDLEFMLNKMLLSGTFSGLSPQTADIKGQDLLFTKDLAGNSPEIDLSADGSGFSFKVDNDLILYDELLITGDGTADFEITGSIRDYHTTPRGVTKEGSSIILLSGPQTYSGTTTIHGGALLLNAGASLINSAVVVEDGGTLGGNGTVSGTITGPGAISPGQSTGTLVASADASPGSLVIEIDATDHDRLEVGGSLDLASTTLSLSDLGGGFTENSYIIASYQSRHGTFGSVSGLPPNYIIDYQFNDGANSNHIALVESSSLTPYQVWIIGSDLGGSDAAFEADPNDDGVQNGIAFFLGAPDAMTTATSLLPASWVSGDHLIFQFDRSDLAAEQTFAAEYSGNLDRWTTAQDGVDGVSMGLDESGALDQITVSLPLTLAEAAALFVRLVVLE